MWPFHERRREANLSYARAIRGTGTASDRTGQYTAAPICAGEVVSVWGGGKVISDGELRRNVPSGWRRSEPHVGMLSNQVLMVLVTPITRAIQSAGCRMNARSARDPANSSRATSAMVSTLPYSTASRPLS